VGHETPGCRAATTHLFMQSSDEGFAMAFTRLLLSRIFRDDEGTSVLIWRDRGPMRTLSLPELLIFPNEFEPSWSIHDCACHVTFDYNKTEIYSLFSPARPRASEAVDKPVIMRRRFIGMFIAVIDSNRASYGRRCPIPQSRPIHRITQSLNS
jgi:hypothetical protein